MSQTEDANWDAFVAQLQSLHRAVTKSTAINVNNADLRKEATSLGRDYFRTTRPPLMRLSIDASTLNQLDELLKRLLLLSLKPNAKASYMALLQRAIDLTADVTVEREIRLSDSMSKVLRQHTVRLTEQEQRIFNTLASLVPSAARSYQQAISDLANPARVSYRGAANELREALREALDHLAPDDEIMGQHNFQLEDGQSKPTRKQKVRYILKARGIPTTAAKVPEGIVETIEEKVSAVVSATYGRINNAAHVQTEKVEVERVKRYLDAVFDELLSIPSSEQDTKTEAG